MSVARIERLIFVEGGEVAVRGRALVKEDGARLDPPGRAHPEPVADFSGHNCLFGHILWISLVTAVNIWSHIALWIWVVMVTTVNSWSQIVDLAGHDWARCGCIRVVTSLIRLRPRSWTPFREGLRIASARLERQLHIHPLYRFYRVVQNNEGDNGRPCSILSQDPHISSWGSCEEDRARRRGWAPPKRRRRCCP